MLDTQGTFVGRNCLLMFMVSRGMSLVPPENIKGMYVVGKFKYRQMLTPQEASPPSGSKLPTHASIFFGGPFWVLGMGVHFGLSRYLCCRGVHFEPFSKQTENNKHATAQANGLQPASSATTSSLALIFSLSISNQQK